MQNVIYCYKIFTITFSHLLLCYYYSITILVKINRHRTFQGRTVYGISCTATCLLEPCRVNDKATACQQWRAVRRKNTSAEHC